MQERRELKKENVIEKPLTKDEDNVKKTAEKKEKLMAEINKKQKFKSMRTIYFLAIIFLGFAAKVNAQITVIPKLPKPVTGVVSNANWVEIYEKKNYGGAKKIITTNSSSTVDLGFRSDTISVKIKPGYMVFLSVNCAEFSNEVALFENTTQFVLANKELCGIRIEKTTASWVRFDGILSAIHNNDCKKFYGNIKFKIFEVNANNDRVYYTLNDAGSYEIQLYNVSKESGAVEPALFNINDFYVADRDYISGVVSDPRRYKPNITRSGARFPKINFKINESAFRNKKVFIEIISNIGSYHKGCDLCSDFTKDAAMATTETKSYNLNAAAWDQNRFPTPTIQVGPFRDAPTGAVTFTGGGGVTANNGIAYHKTYLQVSIK